jgi:competence protein ComEC
MKTHRLLLLALSLASLLFLPSTHAASGKLAIYWVDVEGGAGTLIVTPAGESILIDTGTPGERDPGRIHQVASQVAGLKQIDHLITSHFHIDHFGGAAEVSQNIPIINVHDNGVPEQSPDNPNDRSFPLVIRPYREFKAERRHILKAGDFIPLKQAEGHPPIVLRCIAAMQQVIPPLPNSLENPACAASETRAPDRSDNANSIVVLLQYGDFRFFNGGDLTWNIEASLVCPVNRVGEIDVYQVNHHGLDSSNNPMLVRSLAPTVSVMSNGIRKGCGPETFATLKNTPSIQAMYQIHKNLRGDSHNNTADEFIANLEEKCDANFIQLTVAPGGKEYTVQIPARGHTKTFATRVKRDLERHAPR